ncbi:MAG: hypothetical protein WDA47_09520 [Bacilli bacterium]
MIVAMGNVLIIDTITEIKPLKAREVKLSNDKIILKTSEIITVIKRFTIVLKIIIYVLFLDSKTHNWDKTSFGLGKIISLFIILPKVNQITKTNTIPIKE